MKLKEATICIDATPDSAFWPLTNPSFIPIMGKRLIEWVIIKLIRAGFARFLIISSEPLDLRIPIATDIEFVENITLSEDACVVIKGYDIYAVELLSDPKLLSKTWGKTVVDSAGVPRILSGDGKEKLTLPKLKRIVRAWDFLDVMEELLSSIPSYVHPKAYVDPSAVLYGNVYVDAHAKILPGATVVGPAYIGIGSLVGNSSLVRHSSIGENSIIGARMEVARSLIFNNVETHSGYVGDSILSEHVHLGAEVVTANLRLDRKTIKAKTPWGRIDTAKTKLGAIIGEGTEIGVNVSIMPGIFIGSHARILPNSVVNKYIADGEVYGNAPPFMKTIQDAHKVA